MVRHVVGIMLLLWVLSPLAMGGAEGAFLQMTPSAVDFGDVEVGGAVLRDVRAVNGNKARVTLEGVAIEGDGAAAFRIVNDDCTGILGEGEGCRMRLAFEPESSGRWAARLILATSRSREEIPLTGSASTGARLASAPGKVDFGAVAGGESRDVSVTLAPLGEGTLHIAEVTSPPAPFSVVSDGCSELSLAPGQDCRVDLRFAPKTLGTFDGNLMVRYENPAVRTASIPVKGVRAQASSPSPSQPQPPPAGDLDISARRLDFGPVAIGFGQERQITLRNSGTVPYNIGVVGGANPLAPPFSLAGDGCSKRALAPGGSCRLSVRFAPTQTGAPGDSFDIPTDSPGLGNVRVDVRGEGVSSPLAAIAVRDRLEWEDDGELPFGELLLGRWGVTTVTVINLGSAPLAITDVGVEDALAPPFFLRSDGCSGQVLAPGGECGIQLRFAPRTVGTFSDTFTIRSDDPRHPNLALSLSGAGTVVAGNTPPEPPSLIHPDPDQTSLRDTVTFRWSRCDDPDGDSVFYQLFLSTTPDFTLVEPKLAGVPEGLRLAGIGGAALALGWGASRFRKRKRFLFSIFLLFLLLVASCSDDDEEDNAVLEIGNLDPMTTYYWKVMSDDGRGGLAESEVRSFTTR